MAIPNKLKNKEGFFGRLFEDKDHADQYLARMRMKHATTYTTISYTNVRIDNRPQILVYMHKEKD